MSLSVRNWSLSLLCLVTALFVGSSSAEAQTTVTVGGFNAQFWDPVDGDAYAINETILAGDITAFTAAEEAALRRSLLYWSDVLNLPAATANSSIVRFINDTGDPAFNANALSVVTGGNHNVIDRLQAGMPARDMGIDGRVVFFPDGFGFNPNPALTQFSNDAFSMEMVAIHEIGHLLGVATYSHQPFINQAFLVGGLPFFQGANALAVYGGDGVPLAGDGGHTAIPYENITRGLVLGNDFRNIPHASPAELAILADLGFTFNLSDHFGRAYYQNNTVATDATSYTPGEEFGIGLYMLADNLRVTQNGNLTANGSAGTGIRIVGGMNNTAIVGTGSTVSANGTNGIGILASGGAGHDIVVRGNVGATGTNGVGIRVDFGNPFLFNTITSNSYQQALVDDLDISGTVAGETNAIFIANTAGLNELNIMQGAQINGNIVSNAIVNPGDNLNRPVMSFGRQADANGQSTLMSDPNFNFTYTGNIGGATLFDAVFAGGTSNLNGTSSFNSTDVMLGATLATTGTLNTGPLDLTNGGTLISNGTVNTTSIMMGQNSRLEGSGMINSTTPITVPGTIAPGNSIGTTVFNTNITGTPTTVLEIEAQPAVVPVPGTDNDLIVVNGGSYTFNGGLVNVLGLPPAGAYTVGSQYTYLQTTGGVNVAAAPTLTDDLTNFRAIPFFTMNTAGFTLAGDTPLAAIARTYNQRNFGTYFDVVKLDTSNASAQLIRNNLDMLATPAQVRQAMDQLTGEIHGTMAISQVQNLSNLFTMVSDQVHHNHAPGVPCYDEIWYSGYATAGQGQFDLNANETDFNSTGHLLGKSWCVGEETAMGVFYNYEDDRVTSSSVASTVDSDSHRLGFYLRHQAGNFHALVSGFGGWNSLDSQRAVVVNTLNEFNQGSYSGWNTGLYLEQGLTYGVEFIEFQPYLALQLLQYQSNDFIETGGPNTTLGVNDIHINSFRTLLGGRYNVFASATGFRIGLDGAWVHENADDSGQYEAGLTSTPGAGFNARGLDLGNDWINIGPTMGWNFGPVSMFLDYQASIGEQGTIHSGNGGAELVW